MNDGDGSVSGSPPDPDLSAVAASLRAEWRTDEEAATVAAHRNWVHALSVTDLARGWMQRGDRIEVLYGPMTFRGTVSAVGSDLLVVGTPAGRIDVYLGDPAARTPFVLRVAPTLRDASDAGAAANPVGALSFRGRLLELEADGARVELGLAMPPSALRGVLRVGSDHVVVDVGGVDHAVPLAHLQWVRLAD